MLRFVLVPLILASGLVSANHFTDDMIVDLVNRQGGIEAYQKNSARKLNLLNPRSLGEHLLMNKVAAEGESLRYEILASEDAESDYTNSELQQLVHQEVAPGICENEATRVLLVLYGSVYMFDVYSEASSTKLFSISFDNTSCR